MSGEVTIIGLGLITGSLAAALKRRPDAPRICVCGRDPARLQQAVQRGLADRVEADWARAAQAAGRAAGQVVIGTPVGAMAEVLERIGPALEDGVVVSDVGSTKQSVVEAARQVFGSVPPTLVPAHPIAGTEHSGFEHAVAGLYDGARVILTPLPETDAGAVERVQRLWEQAGARVSRLSPERHDQALAAVSHLPHMLAYSLVAAIAASEQAEELFDLAAGGFRDFTRIASSDPVMWRDICLANRAALGAALQQFRGRLDALAQAIERGDGDFLAQLFAGAKQARDQRLGDS